MSSSDGCGLGMRLIPLGPFSEYRKKHREAEPILPDFPNL